MEGMQPDRGDPGIVRGWTHRKERGILQIQVSGHRVALDVGLRGQALYPCQREGAEVEGSPSPSVENGPGYTIDLAARDVDHRTRFDAEAAVATEGAAAVAEQGVIVCEAGAIRCPLGAKKQVGRPRRVSDPVSWAAQDEQDARWDETWTVSESMEQAQPQRRSFRDRSLPVECH